MGGMLSPIRQTKIHSASDVSFVTGDLDERRSSRILFVAALGFIIGGFVGIHLDHGFHPDCWYGLCVGIILYVGGCMCYAMDFDW